MTNFKITDIQIHHNNVKAHHQEKWEQKLKVIIKLNLQNSSYSVSQLAEQMDMSERGLNYKVKKITGLTPAKYINELRLQRAEALIKSHSFTTVKEICFAVGFIKPAYFSSLFKKRFGMPPSQYLPFWAICLPFWGIIILLIQSNFAIN